jgi:hypothetical protein
VTRSIRVTSRSALVLLAACGGASTVAPKTTPPVSSAVKPSHDVARIEAGDAQFGCVGWSPKSSSAACVLGQRGTMGTWMTLSDTGAGSLGAELSDPITNSDALNALLSEGGYMKFTHDATELEKNNSLVVGNATLYFAASDTPSDVDNTAPQFSTKITAECGGKANEVFFHSEEGREYQASVRRIGDYALLELAWSLAREGEYGSGMDAILVDTKTCDYAATDVDMPTTN